MAKDKEPKFTAKYDPDRDRLNRNIHVQVAHNISHENELKNLLKHASEANEKSGAIAWDLNSDFQKMIEKVIGPLSHYKEANNVESPIGEIDQEA